MKFQGFKVSRFRGFGVLNLLGLGVAWVLLGGCSTEKPEEARGPKGLMIGNSLSICLLQHLPQVAADPG
ncbi:MAG: hypothetical protein KBT68_10010, partial [bacterium]|nr:hypothetical protein [Candidatus Colisoma equi]